MCQDGRPSGGDRECNPPESDSFSAGLFLAERQALVVHFSTPMRTDDSLRFPDDLIQAQTLSEKGLCCSTILATDVGPGEPSIDPAEANAVGCIGIILALNDRDSVCAVHPSDCGTFRDADGNLQYDGDQPTASSCAKSIDCRAANNEWVITKFRAAGIFLFQPIVAQTSPAGSPEREIDLQTAIAPFPNLRIFSTQNGQFVEYDRMKNEWLTVGYDSIIDD